MKKGLLLLIGIVFSLNLGIVENANAQRNHHNQNRNHKEYRKNNEYRHEEKRAQRFDKHENRYGHQKDNRYEGRYEKRRYRQHNKVVYTSNRHHQYRMPFWASAHRYRGQHAVYFRDYNAFYDPNRGGYVYWVNNGWVFSPTVPLYMANFDLNRARIHYIKDVPYGARPELYYRRYAKRYPRNNRIQINIPLPPY